MKFVNSIQQLQRQTSEIGPGQHLAVAGTESEHIQSWLLQELGRPTAPQTIVLVVKRAKDLNQWTEFFDLNYDVLLQQDPELLISVLPFFSIWGRDRHVNPSLPQTQRLQTLYRLRQHKGRHLILTTLPALMQQTLSTAEFDAHTFTIAVGQTVDFESLERQLLNLGYQSVEVVDTPGQFAIRGGIIDIFSPSTALPARLEFNDELVQSIREFQPDSQRSAGDLNQLALIPCREALVPPERREEDTQALYNYLLGLDMDQSDREGMVNAFHEGYLFPGFQVFHSLFRQHSQTPAQFLPTTSLVVNLAPATVLQQDFQELLEECDAYHQQDIQEKKATVPVESHFLRDVTANTIFPTQSQLTFSALMQEETEVVHFRAQELPSDSWKKPADAAIDGFGAWSQRFKTALSDGKHVILLCTSKEQQQRLQHLLLSRQFTPVNDDTAFLNLPQQLPPQFSIILALGYIDKPLADDDLKYIVVPEHMIFGATKQKNRDQKRRLKNALTSFRDLKAGGYVVHSEHGICRYLGLVQLNVSATTADFLHLEFAGGDKLYLPVDRLNHLHRYASGSGADHAPALDRLKSSGWEKRKSKASKAARDIAEKLLAIQARRKLATGHQYSAPGEIYFQFEQSFPFEETSDQLKAISDVNADMSAPNPMDRLICGDVGFGKTEIALRAAMRAVVDGYQVMILAPTTVLSAQHYKTFSARFAGFGVRVAQANRFLPAKDVKQTLQDFTAGRVDILIGTHRLLSKDVKPFRLGLLVIDEEQRFGVEHKEVIKGIAANCDLLTMTATPIPRTLHMALLGLRDISVIATPPRERLSIKTYVAPFNETMMMNAIRQELHRGGQAFVLHNRVETIGEVCESIRQALPESDARIAHGQMPPEALERVILDFIDQKFSVLVCTTIIEAGIDMPNVNTLIVRRADQFGLSQLYQIRGRVGRSHQQAYAYFFTPPTGSITEEAMRRLEILASHQDLGDSFHIANYDLEIRGAGDLIGADQSGHSTDVGVEMYLEMLEQAVRELRGEAVTTDMDVEIKIPIKAHISADYIRAENARLNFYKALFSAGSVEDLDGLNKELADRYGPLPPATQRLFKLAELKQVLMQLRVQLITQKSDQEFELKFYSLSEAQVGNILEKVSAYPRQLTLLPDYRLVVRLDQRAAKNQEDGALAQLAQLISQLSLLLDQPLEGAAHEA